MGKRRIPVVVPDNVDSLLGKPVTESLDLHGLTAAQAEAQVDFFLARHSGLETGAVVRIVTGKGRRSESDPVLLPLVQRLLEGKLARYVARHRLDVGSGAYLVQVR